MNKHEAIKKVEQMGEYERFVNESIPKLGVINILNQLDEPQKVTVPQSVADWYEENKDDFENALFRSIDLMPSTYEEGELSEFEEWLVDEHTNPFQILVNMHQFGYEVEKDKRYLVKMNGIHPESEYLYYGIGSCKWRFREKNESGYFRKTHTRKELEEAGFGEVFNSPLFEVKEVGE